MQTNNYTPEEWSEFYSQVIDTFETSIHTTRWRTALKVYDLINHTYPFLQESNPVMKDFMRFFSFFMLFVFSGDIVCICREELETSQEVFEESDDEPVLFDDALSLWRGIQNALILERFYKELYAWGLNFHEAEERIRNMPSTNLELIALQLIISWMTRDTLFYRLPNPAWKERTPWALPHLLQGVS